jgi:hypothetical protein
VLIQVGDELMFYSSSPQDSNTLTVTRGQNQTVAEPHSAGSVVRLVSGRPDGLFADQIASTDILDLRHLVNPNGFDYSSMLKSNLDKLLRGQLRANWKMSGAAGPRGPYVHYQDALTSASATSVGVTRLDAPDNIRTVFSDAATIQPVEIMCRPLPNANIVVPTGSSIGDTQWSLRLTVNTTKQLASNKFSAADKIVLPVAQLKSGLQGANDQVRWLNDGIEEAVQLRFEGDTHDVARSMFQVSPLEPGPDDDLVIELNSTFPQTSDNRLLHIRAHIVYGPGRGLARRPDALHSISYISPSSDMLTQQWGAPSDNKGTYVAWAPLWSKYRSSATNGLLPVTAEMYADLGSKTVIATPFRAIDFPDAVTLDGRSANLTGTLDSAGNPEPKPGAPTTGTLAGTNGLTINATATNVAEGDALVIATGPGQGRYTVAKIVGNVITVDREIRAISPPVANGQLLSLSFKIYSAQGCMPLRSKSGAAKWNRTDPLSLFCGTAASSTGPTTLAHDSIYVALPRHLVPGWGALAVPILSSATENFPPGINFMIRTASGATVQSNYAAYNDGGPTTKQFSVFSQLAPIVTPETLLEYNTANSTPEHAWAGIQFFTDTRGLGRQGLQFPPFYGLARVLGVYQARDYIRNGSPFNNVRELGGAAGTAVNLLRQSMGPNDGPTMWIEIDSDGDSTFILNANAIDISKAPTPIASFAAGTYAVDAVVFGFDRGAFDLGSECRIVLTRPGNPNAWDKIGASGAISAAERNLNISKSVTGISAVLPGPAKQSEQIVVNYSRTVYQGDPWGSQTSNVDISYAPGPLFSEHAALFKAPRLNQSALSRPNQKVLEVLASTSFSTDLGTGRYSAGAAISPLDFRNVAFEDTSVEYPPASYLSARPKSLPANFVAGDAANVAPEYLGCTERLPLGALFRDKDFRGQAFTNVPAPLVYSDTVGAGAAVGFYGGGVQEQQEITLGPATSGVGSPGDLLVHVDGEQADYALLTNFRVTRGGSVFTASGPRPGGSLSLQTMPVLPQSNHVNVLHGRAMLVRNAVTTVGTSEVSAGDELMMLIVTTAQRVTQAGGTVPAFITIGTSGAGEGYSAADLFRIEGHPLVRDNVHMQVDPSAIVLSRG